MVTKFCQAAFSLAMICSQYGAIAKRTIVVSEHGINSHECWENETISCSTLDFALGGLESDTTIQVHYSHNFSNVTYANITEYMENVAIVGISQPVIYCTQVGDGIAFSNMNNLRISGVSWNGCSHNSPTTAHIKPLLNRTFISAYTALFFYNISNLTIERCQFTSSRGLGVALYDVQGVVNILETDFIENTVAPNLQCINTDLDSNMTCSPHGGGLYIEFTRNGFSGSSNELSDIQGIVDSHYLVDQCSFEGNFNPPAFTHAALAVDVPEGYWPFGTGGGLSVAVRGKSQRNMITIQNCTLLNNTATFGGGINIEVHDYSLNNAFSIINVTITGNAATLHAAGGLRITERSSHGNKYNLNNQFLLNHVTFSNNHAKWGGGSGLAFTRSHSSTTENMLNRQTSVSFNSCTWIFNTALYAGAATFIANLYANKIDVAVNVSFKNCTFQGNEIPTPYSAGRSQRFGQGTIYTVGIPLFFSGQTIVDESLGTALVISAAVVEFAGQVEFTNGQSAQGGAIYLSDISWINLRKGLSMKFQHNSAFEAGGAIYYVYEPARAFNISQACFIQYSDNHTLTPSEWDVTIIFNNNKALYGGNAIHVTDPPGCIWPNGEFLFDISKTHPFNFTLNREHVPIVGTPIHNLTLMSPVNVTKSGHYIIEIMPGEELKIPVNVPDFFNSSRAVSPLDVKCFNYTLVQENMYFEDACGPGGSFNYSGPRVFVVNTSISGIQLGGPINSTDLILTFKTLEVQPIVTFLRVFMNECRYGFHYDEESKYCRCYDSRYAVKCYDFDDSRMQTPCIRIGYWYGEIHTGNSGEGACTFDKCKPSCQEKCQNLEGWCKLPAHDYDLCIYNHAGPLCALCKSGYSYNYDGVFCVPDEDCNPLNAVLVVFVIVTFWVLLIVGLLAIMRMHLRIGSGYVYCFLYYFSILPFMAGNNLDNHSFDVFVGLFYSIVRLDPEFLSQISLCFIKGITAIQMKFFQYFHPLVVTVTIYLIILLSRRCPRLFRFSEQSPLHALCILLLLSYNSLFQTSLYLLAPVTFHNAFTSIPQHVWIQPNTPYFDPTQHLPYALVALLIELFLVVPFTFIMLFAPFLLRWRRMARFKPIWDEYQACYRDKYRWFAGYYLVCRHLIALAAFASPSEVITIFSHQVLNILILLIHAYIQPYRERWLNILDTIFLLDLVFLSIINGSTAAEVFANSFHLQLAIRYILIMIPCLYFTLACTVVAGIKIKTWCDSKSRTTIPIAQEIPDTTHMNTPTSTSLIDLNSGSYSASFSGQEDRPLLDVPTTNYSSQEHDQTPVPSPKSPAVSSPFLNKVAAGVSSHLHYWRTTSLDTRQPNAHTHDQDSMSFDR